MEDLANRDTNPISSRVEKVRVRNRERDIAISDSDRQRRVSVALVLSDLLQSNLSSRNLRQSY